MKNALITILVSLFISTPFVVATPLPPASSQSFSSRDVILDPRTDSAPDLTVRNSKSLNIDMDPNLVPRGLDEIQQAALFQTGIVPYVEAHRDLLELTEEMKKKLDKMATVSKSFKPKRELPSDLKAYAIPPEYFETVQTREEVIQVLQDRESQSGWNKRDVKFSSVKGLEAISDFLAPMHENWATILVHDPSTQPPKARRKVIIDENGRRKLIKI